MKQLTESQTQPKPSNNVRAKGFVDIIEYHSEGHEVEIIPAERFLPTKRKSNKKQQTYKDYAVVLRRTWVQGKNAPVEVEVQLEIQSVALCRAFRKIAVNSYEDTDLSSFPIKLKSPFPEIFFYRDEIKSLMEDESRSEEVRQGAGALYGFVLKNRLMTSIVADHEKYFNEGQVIGDILWTIYPPNSLVVIDTGKLQECWICRNVASYQHGDGYLWMVTGFRIGYDGSSPGLTKQTFKLPVSDKQVCKISDLPLVPIKNYQGWPSLRETLLARAATLQKVLGKDLSQFAPQTYANVGWRTEFSSYSALLNPMLLAKQVS